MGIAAILDLAAELCGEIGRVIHIWPISPDTKRGMCLRTRRPALRRLFCQRGVKITTLFSFASVKERRKVKDLGSACGRQVSYKLDQLRFNGHCGSGSHLALLRQFHLARL
jgi:hypothetical protein